MYRAYASETELYSFIKNIDHHFGIEPVIVRCDWEPRCNVALNIHQEGIYMLCRLPSGLIGPAEFHKTHLKDFEDCMKNVQKSFAQPGVRDNWKKFATLYPKYQDSMEYVKKSAGLHVPLRSLLFPSVRTVGLQEVRNIVVARHSSATTGTDSNVQGRRVLHFQPHVNWKGSKDALPLPPTLVLTQEQTNSRKNGDESPLLQARSEYFRKILSEEEYNSFTVQNLQTRLLERQLKTAAEVRKLKTKGDVLNW
jgi:hypothetical protein